MLKAIRSTLLMLSFVVALTFTATSVSAQEKAQLNKTKVPVTVEKTLTMFCCKSKDCRPCRIAEI